MIQQHKYAGANLPTPTALPL